MPDLPLSASGQTAAEVARLCAREAGAIIMDRFPGRGGGRREPMRPERTMKGRGNFVTETDLACERAALDILAREYPGCPVLSEETADRWVSRHETGDTGDETGDTRHETGDTGRGENVSRVSGGAVPRGEGWLWVVDPLDGTHNFSQGIPQFAFNIALCLDGDPVLGLTFSPTTGEEFFAAAGGGLLVNGQPARASATPSLAQSVWGMDMGYDDARAARLIGLLAEVWPGVQSVRIMGSAALGLAYAACGRYDLFVHHYLFPWDIAPGIVLVREGGGQIVSRDGEPITIYSEGVVAGAPGPVQDFLRVAKGKAWR